MSTTSDFATRKVPRRAMMFAAKFVPTDETTPQRDANGQMAIPFTMTARTGGIAQHPWWGNCIHDFAGMIPAKGTVTVDYCHDPGDVVGFSDRVALVHNALMMEGQLISLKPMDRAEEIYRKRQAGVPYEASILTNWDGLIVEQLSEGMVATVNGQQVEGPLTIFRKWQLWGVAVCPYGSDSETGIEFSAGNPSDVEIRVMTGTAAAVTDPPVKTGRDYLTRFGQAKGALWFAQGKTWHEAEELFFASLLEEKAAKERERDELKAQLADLQKKYDALVKDHQKDQAENAAFRGFGGVGYTEPARVELVQRRFSNLSKGIAAFAASIRLPTDSSARH